MNNIYLRDIFRGSSPTTPPSGWCWVCAVLAITTFVINGLGMEWRQQVLICSNVVIQPAAGPEQVRILFV